MHSFYLWGYIALAASLGGAKLRASSVQDSRATAEEVMPPPALWVMENRCGDPANWLSEMTDTARNTSSKTNQHQGSAGTLSSTPAAKDTPAMYPLPQPLKQPSFAERHWEVCKISADYWVAYYTKNFITVGAFFYPQGQADQKRINHWTRQLLYKMTATQAVGILLTKHYVKGETRLLKRTLERAYDPTTAQKLPYIQDSYCPKPTRYRPIADLTLGEKWIIYYLTKTLGLTIAKSRNIFFLMTNDLHSEASFTRLSGQASRSIDSCRCNQRDLTSPLVGQKRPSTTNLESFRQVRKPCDPKGKICTITVGDH